MWTALNRSFLLVVQYLCKLVGAFDRKPQHHGETGGPSVPLKVKLSVRGGAPLCRCWQPRPRQNLFLLRMMAYYYVEQIRMKDSYILGSTR